MQLNDHVGSERTVETAVKAGIPADTVGLEKNLTNVLGTASPHVLDMAFAYSTFAAQGKRPQHPYVISSVTRIADQGVEYAYKPAAEQVFDPGVMADATYAMQQVIRRGSGSYARGLGRPAAGKTGTSENNKSAWFTGFTPQLATAVALYRPSSDPDNPGELELEGWGPFKGAQITGGSFPVRVWTTFMRAALEGTEVTQLPEPVFGGDVVNPAPPPQPSPTATPSPSGEPSPTPSEGAPPPDGPVDPLPSADPLPTEPPAPPPTIQPPPNNGNGNGNGGAPTQPAT
jgi:membrane peptidoglycan carboxypeptidase